MFSEIVNNTAYTNASWSKIQLACGLALNDGFAYIWVDNCCIDKSSSAELSESLNSVFAWYKDAAICYAYMPDVSGLFTREDLEAGNEFGRSRWFTRGFKLQELLALKKVIFFS
ncbi:heterokaryon incompatibility protein HET [Aspergillus lentulus]|nr:heterokaryon incompatibility protein HET [Aspergillus lentulus]